MLFATIAFSSVVITLSLLKLGDGLWWTLPAVLLILMIEPFIELCTSAISPVAADKANLDRRKFSAISLAIGSAATFSAPWLASPLQAKFGNVALAYTVLSLALLSLLSLIPLLPMAKEKATTVNGNRLKIAESSEVAGLMFWLPK